MQQRSELLIKRLERTRISRRIVAVAVLRIEVDEIREEELRVGSLHQFDRFSHAVGIRFRADLAIDADAIEDVGDFSQSDDLLARLVRAFDDCLTGPPRGKILSIRGSLEVTAY